MKYLLILSVFVFGACVNNTTTTTRPDGTVIVSETHGIDADTVGSISEAIVSVAVPIIAEK